MLSLLSHLLGVYHFTSGKIWLTVSDGTLRLWDLNNGVSTRRFEGHSKDVLSVAFSVDNRQIISGSRDKTVKVCSLWPNVE